MLLVARLNLSGRKTQAEPPRSAYVASLVGEFPSAPCCITSSAKRPERKKLPRGDVLHSPHQSNFPPTSMAQVGWAAYPRAASDRATSSSFDRASLTKSSGASSTADILIRSSSIHISFFRLDAYSPALEESGLEKGLKLISHCCIRLLQVPQPCCF